MCVTKVPYGSMQHTSHLAGGGGELNRRLASGGFCGGQFPLKPGRGGNLRPGETLKGPGKALKKGFKAFRQNIV